MRSASRSARATPLNVASTMWWVFFPRSRVRCRVIAEDVTKAQPALRYVENDGTAATAYPANPGGSPGGLTGFTTPDGRATILMPHPERVFRTIQMSWRDPSLGEDSPWMRMFRNARVWVG